MRLLTRQMRGFISRRAMTRSTCIDLIVTRLVVVGTRSSVQICSANSAPFNIQTVQS